MLAEQICSLEALVCAGSVSQQADILARSPHHALSNRPGLPLKIWGHPKLLEVDAEPIASREPEAGGSIVDLLGCRHRIAQLGCSSNQL